MFLHFFIKPWKQPNGKQNPKWRSVIFSKTFEIYWESCFLWSIERRRFTGTNLKLCWRRRQREIYTHGYFATFQHSRLCCHMEDDELKVVSNAGLGDNVPWVSHVYEYFMSGGKDWLYSRLWFERWRQYHSLEQRAGLFVIQNNKDILSLYGKNKAD